MFLYIDLNKVRTYRKCYKYLGYLGMKMTNITRMTTVSIFLITVLFMTTINTQPTTINNCQLQCLTYSQPHCEIYYNRCEHKSITNSNQTTIKITMKSCLLKQCLTDQSQCQTQLTKYLNEQQCINQCCNINLNTPTSDNSINTNPNTNTQQATSLFTQELLQQCTSNSNSKQSTQNNKQNLICILLTSGTVGLCCWLSCNMYFYAQKIKQQNNKYNLLLHEPNHQQHTNQHSNQSYQNQHQNHINKTQNHSQKKSLQQLSTLNSTTLSDTFNQKQQLLSNSSSFIYGQKKTTSLKLSPHKNQQKSTQQQKEQKPQKQKLQQNHQPKSQIKKIQDKPQNKPYQKVKTQNKRILYKKNYHIESKPCNKKAASKIRWQNVKNQIFIEQIKKDKQVQQNKRLCEICQQPEINCVTDCDHTFHALCIGQTYDKIFRCPYCNDKDIYPTLIICEKCRKKQTDVMPYQDLNREKLQKILNYLKINCVECAKQVENQKNQDPNKPHQRSELKQ